MNDVSMGKDDSADSGVSFYPTPRNKANQRAGILAYKIVRHKRVTFLRKKSTTILVASTHVPAVKRAKFLILEKLPDATGEHYRKVDFQSRVPKVVTIKEVRFTC